MKRFATLILLSLTLITCKTKKSQVSGYENLTNQTSTEEKIQTTNGKIKDCPDELIINAMPTMDRKPRIPNQYYIYKGLRKEINEFDSTWVKKHCKVKTTVAY
jgi:hypothetical protein